MQTNRHQPNLPHASRPSTKGDGINNDYDNDDEDAEVRTMLIVHRTLNDVSRRKQNILVTGLPESSDDHASFEQFCESWLPIKPALSDGSCSRVGQKRSDQPRRLLVKLGSEETATALLRAAPQLRQADDEYVSTMIFFNPDLSRAAAQLAYEKRQLRRESRQRQSSRTFVHSEAAAVQIVQADIHAVDITLLQNVPVPEEQIPAPPNINTSQQSTVIPAPTTASFLSC